MTDLTLPPPRPPEDLPPWLQFPRDMKVNGDNAPGSWFVNHTAGLVWLWLRQPLSVYTQPFSPDTAMRLSEQLGEHAIASIELMNNAQRLQQVKAPLFGPDGQAIG